MVEDDPDYNCCYETDETNVNPVRAITILLITKNVFE